MVKAHAEMQTDSFKLGFVLSSEAPSNAPRAMAQTVVRYHELASSYSRKISGQGPCPVSIQDTETSMHSNLFAHPSKSCTQHRGVIWNVLAANDPLVRL